MQTLVFSIFNTQRLHNLYRNCWLEKLLATAENPQSFKQEKDYYSTKPLAVLLTGKPPVIVTCQCKSHGPWETLSPPQGKPAGGGDEQQPQLGWSFEWQGREGVGWCTESFLWTQTQGSWSELQVTTLSQELPFTAFISCFRVVSSIQDLSLINFPGLPIASNTFLNKPAFV